MPTDTNRTASGTHAQNAIVDQICNELKVHTELGEEIFYPAVRKAIEDADLMDEALVEHAGAKDLVAQLERRRRPQRGWSVPHSFFCFATKIAE